MMMSTGDQIKALRERLNLSQPQFALRFGINLGTLREWEQNRRQPENAARNFLTVISHSPDVVEEAIRLAK